MKSRYQIESTLYTTGIPSEERIMVAKYLLRDKRGNDKVLLEESIRIKLPKEDIRTDDELLQSGILERIFRYAIALVIQDEVV